MATRKELVNEVLRRLREPELGTDSTIASNTYATMVASFLNDVKQECEDAWNWGQLRKTVEFDTVSGTSLYSLPSTTVRTKLLSMWNTTQNSRIRHVTEDYYNRSTLIGTQSNAGPSYYRDRGINAATEHKQIELLATPDGVYTIKAEIVNPQKDLSTDDEKLTLSMARQAMIYGVWGLCISERGEDGGQLMDEIQQKYAFHLSTAIQLDRRSYPNEGDLEVV
tara:strand:+ start:6642 stop:7310 length:669 start_codon:yes stop_codon:yes gene_type:complete